MTEETIYVPMSEKNNNNENDEKMPYDLFKDIENRYLQWMNYYSLFNGALLVAYCTILVSTGQIIELSGGVSTGNSITGNARLFQLECTYWNILALISFLGCIASYCWYLSAIGHYHWIGRWRNKLIDQGVYPTFNFNNKKRAIHYHSTYKVTRKFIAIILFAWIFVCYSSIARDNFQLESCKLFKVFIIGTSLFLAELIMHYYVGSKLSDINKGKGQNEDKYHSEPFSENIKDVLMGIVLIIIPVLRSNEEKGNDLQKIEVNLKILESKSDSLMQNDNIEITLK